MSLPHWYELLACCHVSSGASALLLYVGCFASVGASACIVSQSVLLPRHKVLGPYLFAQRPRSTPRTSRCFNLSKSSCASNSLSLLQGSSFLNDGLLRYKFYGKESSMSVTRALECFRRINLSKDGPRIDALLLCTEQAQSTSVTNYFVTGPSRTPLSTWYTEDSAVSSVAWIGGAL